MNTLTIDANWMPLSKVDVPLLPHREVELTAQRTVTVTSAHVTIIEWTMPTMKPFTMNVEWAELGAA